jgi:uroporphyrinogen-III synthase
MRVLVTRPHDDALETAALLKARGHDPVIAPLLGVHYHDGHPLHLDGVQALLFTSANGARAFARRTSRRDLRVFAVGAQTTEAAQGAGFIDIHNADGDSRMLGDDVRRLADPLAGALLHAAGAQAEGRLAAALTAAGFTVHTEVLYDVPGVTEMPRAARAAWPALDAVLLYSARSATIFADCTRAAGLSAVHIAALCISETAAKPLAGMPLEAIRVAARPTQAALLACLDEGASASN